MSVLSPPPQDELELLIREARARQRRRRLLGAAGVAAGAAVVLSVWAAIPGGGSTIRGAAGAPSSAASSHTREIPGAAKRRPIVEVGGSGGVIWALNGLSMWLTTDGGRTWRASAPKHVRDMGDLIERVQQVDFVDPRRGWVFAVDVSGGLHPAYARHAELDWTSDGGRSWHWTIPKGCCGDVSFLGPRRGFFLGPSKLFATTNGGMTWTPVARTPFAYGVATFADARHGVAVAGKGELFRTSDGGERWSRVELPSGDSVLSPVAAFGGRLVAAAERNASRLVVYTSADGGSTWTARPAPPSWRPFVAGQDGQMFSAVSATVWFAAGWRKLVMTQDGGRSWTPVKVVDLPRGWTISAIDFTSARVGWAVFQSYRPDAAPRWPASVLMRTTDGGVHWAPAGPLRRKAHR